MTDLSRLSAALKAYGVHSELTADDEIEIAPGHLSWLWWDGKSEHGVLLVILRDQVRRVAPGSFACPWFGDGEPDQIVAYARMRSGKDVPRFIGGPTYAPTETAAWAETLIRLAEAGIVPGGSE